MTTNTAIKLQLIIDVGQATTRGTLIATCSAAGLRSIALDEKLSTINDTVAALRGDIHRVACVSMQRLHGSGLSLVGFADALKTDECRARVLLIQQHGLVTKPQIAFVRELGFAGLLSEIDPSDPEQDVRAVLKWLARAADEESIAEISQAKLRTYLKAAIVSKAVETARTLIKALTQLSPEQCVAQLWPIIDHKDRRYHLQTFAHCFVGSDAVTAIAARFKLTRPQSVAIGAALMNLGCVHHVAHDQPFADEGYFYRLNAIHLTDQVSLASALTALESTTSLVADRTYRTASFPQCFVGSAAIDVLVQALRLSREQALAVMIQLEGLRFFTHVTGEHGIIDGNYFYRFRT